MRSLHSAPLVGWNRRSLARTFLALGTSGVKLVARLALPILI